jgi:hypothetical protein
MQNTAKQLSLNAIKSICEQELKEKVTLQVTELNWFSEA